MNSDLRRRLPILLTLLLMPLAQADTQSGTQWRVTTTMTGMGMSLPARTTEVCSKGDEQDRPTPPSSNPDCATTEVARSGNSIKYSVKCTGKDPMEGVGQITYGKDQYTGNFNIKTARGDMSMNYQGQKVGPCTGNEANGAAKMQALQSQQKAVQAQQSQYQQAVAQGCTAEAEAAPNPYGFMDKLHTGAPRCADPAAKQSYCTHFQSYKPFTGQREMQTSMANYAASNPMATPYSDSLKLCGLSADAVHAKLCSTAEGDNEFEFLTKECPTQLQAIAARECAGRSYTSVGARYRGICSTYATSSGTTASSNAAATASSPPAAADAAKDSVKDKAKSVLKGLFGR